MSDKPKDHVRRVEWLEILDAHGIVMTVKPCANGVEFVSDGQCTIDYDQGVLALIDYLCEVLERRERELAPCICPEEGRYEP